MPETPLPVDTLSLPLIDVLTRMPDRKLSGQLRRVYQAAARAILRLSDIDLIKYETTVTDGSPDLSLWEEMAPVIRDTVMDVNALLNVVREAFPVNLAGGIADTLSQAIEEAGGSNNQERRVQEAEKILQDFARQLAQEVTHLGERMRSPAVVSDRWNLLADLQAFRSKFRELMGDLVYQTASSFAEVNRKEVVPGYREEVTASVLIRGTVTDLSRLMGSRLEAIKSAEAEDVQWYAQQLEKDLDAFGRTPAYRSLRAQDKRQIIEFRAALGKLAPKATSTRDELADLLGPFVEMIGSLSKVNNREVLISHDREVWAGCGVRLENVERVLKTDPTQASKALSEAAAMAQELYGREPQLDAFLRKTRKTPLAGLSGDALQDELNHFRELLANLPIL